MKLKVKCACKEYCVHSECEDNGKCKECGENAYNDNSLYLNDKWSKCLYCDNMTLITHFESQCCGRGMCEACYQGLQGTVEQFQVDHMDDEDYETIKPEYQDATYLCFQCDNWRIKN